MKKTNKIIALFLTIIMIMSVAPLSAMAVEPYKEGEIAGTTGLGQSEEDPVIVDTYFEWNKAMEEPRIKFVAVAKNLSASIDSLDVAPGDYFVVVEGEKIWTLEAFQ